jgi:glycosyltransferase involved in cell wall biosynthesis
MKISIITVCFNSEKTIFRTIKSVMNQTYPNIEHIFVDGGSTDSTLKIIQSYNYKNKIVISEPDNGIYDAMNKGFYLSSGEVIAFLNSDDFYCYDNVISDIMESINNPYIDFVYGDINIINQNGKIVRFWCSGDLKSYGLDGRQLPHPAFFVKRNVLDLLNIPFDTSYHIAADLKQQLLIINKFSKKGFYFKKTLVMMMNGGKSTKNFRAYLSGWRECIRAYNEVFQFGGIFFTLRKIFFKIGHIRI